MKLTKNFTLTEMLQSQTATRRGFDEQFVPSVTVVDNLKSLCENALQPLRNAVGIINVSSGYRCLRVNKAINGSKRSQHLKGEAADFTADKLTNKELFEKIKTLNIPFDQLILEFPDADGEPSWIHLSHKKKGKQRGEILVAKRIDGKVVYQKFV